LKGFSSGVEASCWRSEACYPGGLIFFPFSAFNGIKVQLIV